MCCSTRDIEFKLHCASGTAVSPNDTTVPWQCRTSVRLIQVDLEDAVSLMRVDQ